MDLLSLCLILLTSFCSSCALEFQPCPLQAEENSTNVVLECRGIALNEQVTWNRVQGSTDTDVGSCDPNGSCVSKIQALMTLSRPSSDVSTLTMTSVSRALYGGAVFTCRSFAQTRETASASCQMDVVYNAEVSNCSVSTLRVGDEWKVKATCFIDKVFSSLNRYTCELLEQLESGEDNSLANASYSPSSDSGLPYAWGSCDVTSPLNPEFRSYFVVVHPGSARVYAGSVNPVLPSVPPTFTCSPLQETYVTENEAIQCACSTSDLGQPPGRLINYHGDLVLASGNLGDETLTLPTQTFSRHDDGTVLRCVLESDWAEESKKRLETNLTVNVAYGPDAVELSGPDVIDLHPSGLSTMTLTCNVTSAKPSLTFVWQGACSDHTGNICTFAPSIADNGTTVVCAAYNQFTNITKVASRVLELNYPPQSAPVITGYHGSLLHPGQSLQLFCDVTGGYPLVETVTFVCPGQGQEVQGQHSSLNVTVEVGNHGDECVCTAKWKIPEWYSLRAVTTLIVNQSVEIMSVTVNDASGLLTVNESTGDNLTVACLARGVPSPVLSILSDGEKLLTSMDGGQLSGTRFTRLSALVSASCESSATYTCVAEDRDQQLRANVTLNVLCSPRLVPDNPRSTSADIDLGLNDSSLAFTLESNPAPNLFSFLSLSEEDSTNVTGRGTVLNGFNVDCSATGMTSRHHCVITARVPEVTEGLYGLEVENPLGQVLVKFRVSQTNDSSEPIEIYTSSPARLDQSLDIVVIVLAVLLALFILASVLLIVCFLRLRRKQQLEKDESPMGGGLGDEEGYLTPVTVVQPALNSDYDSCEGSRSSHVYDTSIAKQRKRNETPENTYMEMGSLGTAQKPEEHYVSIETTKSWKD